MPSGTELIKQEIAWLLGVLPLVLGNLHKGCAAGLTRLLSVLQLVFRQVLLANVLILWRLVTLPVRIHNKRLYKYKDCKSEFQFKCPGQCTCDLGTRSSYDKMQFDHYVKQGLQVVKQIPGWK